jgi:hypothetical protein
MGIYAVITYQFAGSDVEEIQRLALAKYWQRVCHE